MRSAAGVGALSIAAACSFSGANTPDGSAADAVRPDAARADAAVDATPDAMPVACLAPYTLTSLGCHAFLAPSAMRWLDARATCQALSGGDLPIIDTVGESAYVAGALMPTDGRRIWIGLSGAGIDGSAWRWVDGETVAQKGLSQWQANEPDITDDCAVVRPDTTLWAGRGCNELLAAAVCEKY